MQKDNGYFFFHPNFYPRFYPSQSDYYLRDDVRHANSKTLYVNSIWCDVNINLVQKKNCFGWKSMCSLVWKKIIYER